MEICSNFAYLKNKRATTERPSYLEVRYIELDDWALRIVDILKPTGRRNTKVSYLFISESDQQESTIRFVVSKDVANHSYLFIIN